MKGRGLMREGIVTEQRGWKEATKAGTIKNASSLPLGVRIE